MPSKVTQEFSNIAKAIENPKDENIANSDKELSEEDSSLRKTCGLHWFVSNHANQRPSIDDIETSPLESLATVVQELHE